MRKKLMLVGVIIAVGMITATLLITTPWERGGDETVTVTDMTGRDVKVPKEVDEIVGIGPGALRLIVYMNATDKVVGVEDWERPSPTGSWKMRGRPYIIAHPELSELPSIGPAFGGDAELIAAQDPDVIFWTFATAGDAEDLQKKTGIPAIALEYGNHRGFHRGTLYDALSLMGNILNKEDRVEEVTRYINSVIQDLENRTKDLSSEKSVYVGGIGHHGRHGITSTYSNYTPFQFVHANNVAGNLNKTYVDTELEQVIDWDPDIIFIDELGYSQIKNDIEENRESYELLTAVKKGQLFGLLPFNLYTTNYGTTLADSYYIGKVLYPSNFSDVQPAEKMDEISEKLVCGPVYDNMTKYYKGFKNLSGDLLGSSATHGNVTKYLLEGTLR